MSVGPLGGLTSLAGLPLAQSRSSESVAQPEAAAAERAERSAERAAKAGGIHAPDAESRAQERDADGRRLWELPDQPPTESDEPQPPAGVRNPQGTTGQHLDLTG